MEQDDSFMCFCGCHGNTDYPGRGCCDCPACPHCGEVVRLSPPYVYKTTPLPGRPAQLKLTEAGWDRHFLICSKAPAELKERGRIWDATRRLTPKARVGIG